MEGLLSTGPTPSSFNSGNLTLGNPTLGNLTLDDNLLYDCTYINVFLPGGILTLDNCTSVHRTKALK